MKSMTAYAQVLFSVHARRFRLEIQTLNKKGLDIITDLPQSFFSLNIPIRLKLASKIERGSVLVRLKEESSDKTQVQEKTLKLLKNQLETLAKNIGYSKKAVGFEMLLNKASSVPVADLQMEELDPILEECLSDLLKMRANEGSRLKKDLLDRIYFIQKELAVVASTQEKAPVVIKEKLLERLKNLDITNLDEERLYKEVIYYVEKQDVSEELTRLSSHLMQMIELINGNESCGRKLEFLVQECFRELNTLSAKTSELKAINIALQLKNELEKIKEQVMNIE